MSRRRRKGDRHDGRLCQLMARLRAPGEPRPPRHRFYRAPLRLCQADAVALVKFAGDDRPRRVCEHHLLDELTDRMTFTIAPRAPIAEQLQKVACPSRAADVEWFEPFSVRRGKAPRDYSPALELAERFCINRAPTERSWQPLDRDDDRRREATATM